MGAKARRWTTGAAIIAAWTALAGAALGQTVCLTGDERARVEDRRVDANTSATIDTFRGFIRDISDTDVTTDPPNAVTLLQGARDMCGRFARARKSGRDVFYNLTALECYSRANLRLAARVAEGRAERYREANCAFSIAAGLAEQARNTTLAAEAREGEALALVARYESGESAVLLEEAIAAYGKAIALQDTRPRRAAYARLLERVGRSTAADAEYTRLSETGSTAERSASLVDRARLRQRVGPPAFNAANILSGWEAASGANTAEVWVRIGEGRLAGDPGRAREAFNSALVSSGDAAGTDVSAPRREANYYLTALDARTASGNAAWDAILAKRNAIGTSDPRTRRLFCLALIARGGDEVKRSTDLGVCDVDTTAEGQLMRGFYWLRRAQYVEPDPRRSAAGEATYRQYISNAQQAFAAGRSALTGLATDRRTVNWPEAPESLSLDDLYAIADVSVTYMSAFCFGNTFPATPGQSVAARDFFRRHNLIWCRGS